MNCYDLLKAQHQWHRVEDELPSKVDEDVFYDVYTPNEDAKWRAAARVHNEHHDESGWRDEDFCWVDPTHWRYSTPPRGIEDE